jgi:hypothetical protein
MLHIRATQQLTVSRTAQRTHNSHNLLHYVHTISSNWQLQRHFLSHLFMFEWHNKTWRHSKVLTSHSCQYMSAVRQAEVTVVCVSIQYIFVYTAILHALCMSRAVSFGSVNSSADCQQQINYELWKVARFEVLTVALLTFSKVPSKRREPLYHGHSTTSLKACQTYRWISTLLPAVAG